jgi:hypothetical protein
MVDQYDPVGTYTGRKDPLKMQAREKAYDKWMAARKKRLARDKMLAEAKETRTLKRAAKGGKKKTMFSKKKKGGRGY